MTGSYEQHTGIVGADAMAAKYPMKGTSPAAKMMAQAFTPGRAEPEPKPKPRVLTDEMIRDIWARWNKRQPAQQED